MVGDEGGESGKITKRSWLKAVVVGLIGAASALQGLRIPKVQAADGDTVKVGYTNTGSSPGNSTQIAGNVPGGAVILASNSASTDESTAIWGDAQATSGENVGVRGHSYSPNGTGAIGAAVATTGHTVGVYGQARSPDGTGVFGDNISTTGFAVGVYGEARSPDGVGISGHNSSTTGYAIGVLGTTASPNESAGVAGWSTATTGSSCGVYGAAHTTTERGGSGVVGHARVPQVIPLLARGAPGQTASLQEWWSSSDKPLSVINKDGWMGIGVSSPARMLHIQGGNACSRFDRDVNSAAFIFVRTALNDFNTVWKSFVFGADASGVNNGRFFIGDLGTNVAGGSVKRLVIDNTGKVGIGTETPTELLHVAGNVKASGFITGDIVMSNSARITEESDGFAFVNKRGTKIAVLDEEGNLHIKGEVIKDL